jgi:putative oxidoreductase
MPDGVPVHTIDREVTTMSGKPQAKATHVLIYTLQVILAAAFLAAAYAKLTGDPAMAGLFEKIGFGQWLRYTTGVLEIVGAILLLTRSWSAVAAVGLAALMLFAAVLGIGYYDSPSMWLWSMRVAGGFPFAPNILVIACLLVAYVRREQFARFAYYDASVPCAFEL